MAKEKKNIIRQLNDVEHVLLRPATYIGATTKTKCSTFLLDETEHFHYGEIEYVPGFLKIIYEVLDNSVDECIRTNFKKATKISVDIDRKSGEISVSDDGRGIPLGKMEGSEISQLEGALTCLRAGSNFDDSDRTLLGMNGVGSALTNIFSKEFKAVVYDGKQKGVLTCKDNLSKKKCVISDKNSDKTGTTITFTPDLKRFGLNEIDEIHEDLVRQRLMFLSVTYPEISFKFNGKKVGFKNAKGLLERFSDEFVEVHGRGYLIGVFPNTSDEFNHKSYINGADCVLGGNHLDVICGELVGRIKEKLSKKYSSIKPGDIKNRLSLVVNLREFPNPMFNSQTKENFSSNAKDIEEFLKDVDWDSFAKKICSNDAILEPIVESFKIKEELKNRKTLEKIGSNRGRFKCKKFMPATEKETHFVIVEGDSAAGGLSEGLGRKEMGFFSTRGVPVNCYEATANKIAGNEEMTNIVKLLNLKLGAKSQDMSYNDVVIASDADSDGAHITMLYIAFFAKYCPSIIKEGKLKKLLTPIVCLKDKKEKIVEAFFTLDEYNAFLKKNPKHGLKEKYYKGLGSWESGELRPLVDKLGINRFIQTLEFDKDSLDLIDDWNAKNKVEVRKEYLRQNKFSIFGV